MLYLTENTRDRTRTDTVEILSFVSTANWTTRARHYTYPYAMWASQPNILTVCNGAKRVTNSQDHSVVSTVAGELIPRLMLVVGIEPTLGAL
jgi:hypothetical protein